MLATKNHGRMLRRFMVQEDHTIPNTHMWMLNIPIKTADPSFVDIKRFISPLRTRWFFGKLL